MMDKVIIEVLTDAGLYEGILNFPDGIEKDTLLDTARMVQTQIRNGESLALSQITPDCVSSEGTEIIIIGAGAAIKHIRVYVAAHEAINTNLGMPAPSVGVSVTIQNRIIDCLGAIVEVTTLEYGEFAIMPAMIRMAHPNNCISARVLKMAITQQLIKQHMTHAIYVEPPIDEGDDGMRLLDRCKAYFNEFIASQFDGDITPKNDAGAWQDYKGENE